MSETMDKKVEMVRSFFKKEQPKNHPIKDHPLEKCEEYTKNLYVDMLCVFAMYDNDDTENQFNFIQRIMSGIEDTLSINDHIKRAMEITVDKVSEFIKQIQDNDIKDIFFIDALIISCANGSPTKKQTEFLAEFGDTLGFVKNDIRFFSELVVSVLEGNSDKFNEYVAAYKNVEKYVESATCYLKTNLEKILFFTDKKVYCCLEAKGEIEKFSKGYTFRSLDSVTLENVSINKKISFDSITKVILTGCTFERCGTLEFTGVEELIINNSEFRSLGPVFAFKYNCKNIKVTNSLFENCYASVGDGSAVIVSTNGANMKFENTIFKNIQNGHSDYRYDHVIISYNNQIEMNNCEFYNCTWKPGSSDYRQGMFGRTLPKEKDNKYMGCHQS